MYCYIETFYRLDISYYKTVSHPTDQLLLYYLTTNTANIILQTVANDTGSMTQSVMSLIALTKFIDIRPS